MRHSEKTYTATDLKAVVAIYNNLALLVATTITVLAYIFLGAAVAVLTGVIGFFLTIKYAKLNDWKRTFILKSQARRDAC